MPYTEISKKLETINKEKGLEVGCLKGSASCKRRAE